MQRDGARRINVRGFWVQSVLRSFRLGNKGLVVWHPRWATFALLAMFNTFSKVSFHEEQRSGSNRMERNWEKVENEQGDQEHRLEHL